MVLEVGLDSPLNFGEIGAGWVINYNQSPDFIGNGGGRIGDVSYSVRCDGDIHLALATRASIRHLLDNGSTGLAAFPGVVREIDGEDRQFDFGVDSVASMLDVERTATLRDSMGTFVRTWRPWRVVLDGYDSTDSPIIVDVICGRSSGPPVATQDRFYALASPNITPAGTTNYPRVATTGEAVFLYAFAPDGTPTGFSGTGALSDLSVIRVPVPDPSRQYVSVFRGNNPNPNVNLVLLLSLDGWIDLVDISATPMVAASAQINPATYAVKMCVEGFVLVTEISTSATKMFSVSYGLPASVNISSVMDGPAGYASEMLARLPGNHVAFAHPTTMQWQHYYWNGATALSDRGMLPDSFTGLVVSDRFRGFAFAYRYSGRGGSLVASMSPDPDTATGSATPWLQSDILATEFRSQASPQGVGATSPDGFLALRSADGRGVQIHITLPTAIEAYANWYMALAAPNIPFKIRHNYVDDQLTTAFAFTDWTGNVWDMMSELAAMFDLVIYVEDGGVVIEPPNPMQIDIPHNSEIRGPFYSNRASATAIEVVNQGTVLNLNDAPDSGRFIWETAYSAASNGNEVFTIEDTAGGEVVIPVETTGNILGLDPVVSYSIRSQARLSSTGWGMVSLSMSDWLGAGGRVDARLGDGELSLIVTNPGAIPINYGAAGEVIYTRFDITNVQVRGVLVNQNPETIRIGTGADPSRESESIGIRVESPFTYSRRIAWSQGVWAAYAAEASQRVDFEFNSSWMNNPANTNRMVGRVIRVGNSFYTIDTVTARDGGWVAVSAHRRTRWGQGGKITDAPPQVEWASRDCGEFDTVWSQFRSFDFTNEALAPPNAS